MDVGRLADAEAFTTLDGSTISELAGAVSLATENQSLAQATVPPGGDTEAHFHRRTEEIYFFTAGSGRMRLGEEESDVRAGDCVVIPPGTEHKLWNPSGRAAGAAVLLRARVPHEDTVVTQRATE